jgi:hypothetical protein
MATVPFDTLALARKLEAAGFAPKQAQATAAALAETLGEDMPTRRDLSEATSSLRTEMRELEGRLVRNQGVGASNDHAARRHDGGVDCARRRHHETALMIAR